MWDKMDIYKYHDPSSLILYITKKIERESKFNGQGERERANSTKKTFPLCYCQLKSRIVNFFVVVVVVIGNRRSYVLS